MHIKRLITIRQYHLYLQIYHLGIESGAYNLPEDGQVRAGVFAIDALVLNDAHHCVATLSLYFAPKQRLFAGIGLPRGEM